MTCAGSVMFAVCAVLGAGGCGLTLDFEPRPSASDAGDDTGSGLDSGAPTDAAMDGDTTPRLDASVDVIVEGGMSDTLPTTDGGPADRGTMGCPPVGERFEIASAEVMGDIAGNIIFSPAYHVGWRFVVPPCGMDLTEVGFYGDTETGGFFAAIVRLPDITRYPMTPDLTGSDVLAIMNFDSREGFTGDITTPFSARLDGGGAYAVVFGAGSFGAERVQGFVHGGHRRVAGAQLPFTARQSDGIFIDQMGEYRVFVVGNAL